LSFILFFRSDILKNKYSVIIIPPQHEKTPSQLQFSLKAKKVVVIGSVAFGLFFLGMFLHNIYQQHYIKSYQQKIAYVDELAKEIQAKDSEIARLNEKSTQINNNLQTIASIQKKIAGILKINPDTSSSTSSGSGADSGSATDSSSDSTTSSH
jgi:hypothetical protein